MQDLDKQVREALIEQEAEELYQLFSSSDEQKKMTEEVVREMGNSFVNAYEEHEKEGDAPLDREEVEDLREEFKGWTQKQISQLYNPKQLKEMAKQQARTSYKTEEEYRAEVQSQIEYVRKDDEVEDDVLAKYAESHEIIIRLIRNRDKITKRLVEIAEKEGVEKATQKETRYAVIRELFPAREDYKALQKRAVEELERFYSQAGNALMQDGEIGKLAGRIMSNMAKVIQKFKEKFKQVQTAYLEKELDAIYGK